MIKNKRLLEEERLLNEAYIRFPSGTYVYGLQGGSYSGTIRWYRHDTYNFDPICIDASGNLYIGIDEFNGTKRALVYDKSKNKWCGCRNLICEIY